ncbi:MAG: hypothetical protein ACTSYC_03755 [Promethearchaeota archaeon]
MKIIDDDNKNSKNNKESKMDDRDYILSWGFISLIFGLIGLIQLSVMEQLFSLIIPSIFFILIGAILLIRQVLKSKKNQ